MQGLNDYIVGQVVWLGGIDRHSLSVRSNRRLDRRFLRCGRRRPSTSGAFLRLCRKWSLLFHGIFQELRAEDGGNITPLEEQRGLFVLVAVQNVDLNAGSRSKIIRCFAGFKLHRFRAVSKHFRQKLGNLRVAVARAEP